MRVKRTGAVLAIAISVGCVLLGIVANGQVTNILAVGRIAHSDLFDGPATVTVRTLTINPGASLAWHYHPGYAFNVVKSGTLTVEDGCGGEETLLPGDAFEEMDGRVHRAKNLSSTEPVVVYNTFIVPEGKPTTVNIPGNERRCGPPSEKSECKDNAWMNFTHPNRFSNQGECVQHVRQRPRTIIPVPQDPLN